MKFPYYQQANMKKTMNLKIVLFVDLIYVKMIQLLNSEIVDIFFIKNVFLIIFKEDQQENVQFVMLISYKKIKNRYLFYNYYYVFLFNYYYYYYILYFIN